MRMCRANLLAESQDMNGGTYHVISRVVWRQFIFGAEEKQFLQSTLRRYEKFCGVQILSYCIMSNHFHALVQVPAKPTERMCDELFLEKLRCIYSEFHVLDIERKIQLIRDGEETGEYLNEGGAEALVDELKELYTRRMYDLSEFMKAVKQKMTSWYNRRNGVSGTMWEGRFKSVLVQGGFATRMTAAYIDLNPLRAGIVSDPTDYRWCSYAEAVAGQGLARRGLLAVMNVLEDGVGGRVNSKMTQAEALNQYRMLLAEEGVENAYEEGENIQLGQSAEKMRKRSKGFSKQEVKEVLDVGGKLSWNQVLRCRTRYFTDGVVIGSESFVNDFFERLKERTGMYQKRKTGARKMAVRGIELNSMRNLVRDVFGGRSTEVEDKVSDRNLNKSRSQ